MQALVDPVPDLLTEVLRHAGHPRDDLNGEGTGEVLHDVEVVRIGLAEIVLDEFDDGLALRLDGLRGERLVEQAAHVAMVRRVHEDDRLLWHLAGADHAGNSRGDRGEERQTLSLVEPLDQGRGIEVAHGGDADGEHGGW